LYAYEIYAGTQLTKIDSQKKIKIEGKPADEEPTIMAPPFGKWENKLAYN